MTDARSPGKLALSSGALFGRQGLLRWANMVLVASMVVSVIVLLLLSVAGPEPGHLVSRRARIPRDCPRD